MPNDGSNAGNTMAHTLRRLVAWGRLAVLGTVDAFEKVLGRNDPLLPPRRLASAASVGHGNFRKVGQVWKRHLIDFGRLEPDSRVLDVGCGLGRMAVPLTEVLSADGVYRGFDIVPEAVAWCCNAITPRFPNFEFAVSPVHNQRYNPTGTIRASEHKFPYEDDSFDFVFLTSVFTHMLPADLDNYVAEIARVLKPDRPCLCTFFLLNDESRSCIEAGRSVMDFRHELDGCVTSVRENPEAALAYDEQTVRDLHNRLGLDIVEPIHYGKWCGRESFIRFQDIVVATKRAGA